MKPINLGVLTKSANTMSKASLKTIVNEEKRTHSILKMSMYNLVEI